MAASDRSDPILGGVAGIISDLEGFYKDIHSHPELPMQKERTSAKAAERLETAGFEVRRGVGKTGVVGLLRNGAGPTMMLRADMDALPIKENTVCPALAALEEVAPGDQAIPEPAELVPRSGQRATRRSSAA